MSRTLPADRDERDPIDAKSCIHRDQHIVYERRPRLGCSVCGDQERDSQGDASEGGIRERPCLGKMKRAAIELKRYNKHVNERWDGWKPFLTRRVDG
jgi:hypothetical protein